MKLFGSAIAMAMAMAMRTSGDMARAYQRMRPVTDKNIGRNRLKNASSRYMPHQGKRECARRLRQWARIEARRAAQ